MSDNQYVFEIIRDIGFLIQNIKPHETVWFHVTNDGGEFFTARSSAGMPCGCSETSRAIEHAYKVTRGCTDPRDIEITRLRSELAKYHEYKEDFLRWKKYKASYPQIENIIDQSIALDNDNKMLRDEMEKHKANIETIKEMANDLNWSTSVRMGLLKAIEILEAK